MDIVRCTAEKIIIKILPPDIIRLFIMRTQVGILFEVITQKLLFTLPSLNPFTTKTFLYIQKHVLCHANNFKLR